MRIEIHGAFRGTSGHDRLTREFARAMVRLGAQVQLNGIEDWSPDLPAGARDNWFDTLTTPIDADASLHFMMPNRCSPRPGRLNFNYTMFEANGVPADWVARTRDYRRTIVPTEACKEAWIRSGAAESSIRICPLGVDGEYFSRPTPAIELHGNGLRSLASYRTRFLNVAELRPRKNHIGLLRTWIRATQAQDDAVLVLKCMSTPYLLQIFQEDLVAMQMALGRSFAQAAPVIVLTNLMSDEEIRALYHAASHYISMSNGEGWDLPMMEAATTGLQLIAPNHSGYRTYLTAEDAELLPVREVPATFEGRVGWEDHIFFDGLSWWRPDEDAAADLIARIIRGECRPKASPAERIRKEFTWERAAARLLQIIENEL